MSRKLLQTINALLGILTLLLAGMQILFGVESPVYESAAIPEFPLLDSNLRFFGGMGIGLGAILLWITPTIERRTHLFRAVWLCAWLGGIGRLVSMALVGMPSLPLTVFTVIEVLGAPFLIVWQTRVAQQFEGDVLAKKGSHEGHPLFHEKR